MYKFRTPRKNEPWVYFYYSNLKVGPFGPPPVALGLIWIQTNEQILIPVLKTHFSLRGSPCQAGSLITERPLLLHTVLGHFLADLLKELPTLTYCYH